MKTSYAAYIDYLFWKSYGSGIPLSGTFELTARCNLDCKMCYIHKRAYDSLVKKNELSTKEWVDMATVAQKKGMLLLLLTGGEPFLRSDFKQIYTECRKLGLLISINSNGTLINDDMIEFLRKDPPIRMNITLYGASPETYKELCGDANAYERAYYAVLALKKAGIQVKLNYSVTPQTLKDAPKVYSFAKEQGIPIQAATYMFPPVRACEHSECTIERLTPKQAAQARWDWDYCRFSQEELKKEAKAMLNGNSIVDSDNECQEFPTERIRCRAGSTTFWMTYDGQMRPCGMMQVPSVNARELGFECAWEQIRQKREEIMIPAKCTACKWKNICEFCPAVCFAENGDYEKTPDYICEKMKEYIALVQNYVEKNS